jgi:hypothetical protein
MSIPADGDTYDRKRIAFYKAGEVEEVWVLMKGVTEISRRKVRGVTRRCRKNISLTHPPRHKQLHPVTIPTE